MAAKIFLAHAREDKALVRTLYADLKARGFDPWLDEVDLLPGQIWKTEIPKAIREAAIFLACLSSRSVGKVGYLQNEFRLALSAFSERPPGSIYLIPVRLDDCDVPDLQIPDRGLSLRDIQWVDQWQEGGFDRLVRAIEKALEVPNQPPRLRRPAEAMALRSGVAPDQAPVHIPPEDTDITEFLSQSIDKDTLSYYTKWKYPKLPINAELQEKLLRDLSCTNVKTLSDLDCAVDAAANAVDAYRKETPGFFTTGTDFLTKSLGFVDKVFRAQHGFSIQTKKAFLKYEHLVQSEKIPEVAPDQKVIEEPPETAAVEPAPNRERPRRGSPLWRNPTVVAAMVGAIGVVAVSLWLLEKISDGSGRNGQETQETPAASHVEKTSPEATPEPVPKTPLTEAPFRDCDDCPLMVTVRAGSFLMGSPQNEQGRSPDESPQHNVAIPEFALGQYEVTVGQFKAFVQATKHDMGDGCWEWDGSQWKENKARDWRAPGFEQTDDHPLVCVSWEGAQAYVAWLSQQTNQPYRLLSEAEWEYACRAGTTTRYSWGDDLPTPQQANFDLNVNRTTEVGAYPPNPWGLQDMHGNVWEWVEDCWNKSYQGAPGDGSAWKTGDCSRRVLRGGSWYDAPENLRAANRVRSSPDFRSYDVGFRVARTLR